MADDRARLARGFVTERFTDGVMAAFLGGSAASGTATPGSDLDVVVILDERWAEVAFVETSRFGGMLVEAFVCGPRGLDRWLAGTRRNGRPTVERLIAESIMLVDTDLARGLREDCRRALAAGPASLVGQELDEARYAVSALLNDLGDVDDPATDFAVAAALWRASAELSLRSRGAVDREREMACPRATPRRRSARARCLGCWALSLVHRPRGDRARGTRRMRRLPAGRNAAG